jgi:thioesterase domain-containing protein
VTHDFTRPADGRSGPLRTRLEAEVASCWEAVLGVGPIDAGDDFFTLGGSSLPALRMIADLETRLGLTLPLAALVDGATVARVARALTPIGATPLPSLVRFRPGHAGRPPLVCVHPAGGSALCYLELARRLPPDQPVFGFEEPASLRGDDLTVEARAATYLSGLGAWPAQGPVHLAGYSFGGLIALEMARQLAAAGRDPGLVVLIDTMAPGDPDSAGDPGVRQLADILEHGTLDADDASVDPAADLQFWRALSRFANDVLGVDTHGGRFGAVERFCRHYRLLPATPLSGYAEIRALLRALRAALRSAKRYAPSLYPGPVVLLQATAASIGTPDDARSRRDQQRRRWASLCARVDVHDVPGHHFDLLGPDGATAIASVIDTLVTERRRE